MQPAPGSEGSWAHRSRVEINFGDRNEKTWNKNNTRSEGNIKQNPHQPKAKERRTRAEQERTGRKEERKERQREARR